MKKLVWLVTLALALGVVSCIPSGRDYGKELYEENCANCHGSEGNGLQKLYPPLKNSDYLVEHQNELACLIRFGMEGKITVNGIEYAEPMPGKPLLSEIDIHNIINYISKNINTNLKPVQIQDVNNQVLNCSTK